jgi:hypothetical protein
VKRALSAAALLAGCAAVSPQPTPLTGNWGGTHVGLHLTRKGGTLDYDCAHGTIGPVLIGLGGRFTAEGTHTPEHGGPVRQGEVLPNFQARYQGRIRGDRMTLQGTYVDERVRGPAATAVMLGPFELRRGAAPQLFRCL